MRTRIHLTRLSLSVAIALAAMLCGASPAEDITFFSYSDSHYGAGDGRRLPPTKQEFQVRTINSLPGTPYPEEIGGVVDVPRAILMQGDLINDGAVMQKYPDQWKDYLADFGVNGEGRCKFPVFEGVGNHDVNANNFVFNQVKERNVVRKRLGLIDHVSENGYHYSWDWEGVHFVNVNLFPGNVWEGEADAYGRAHHPQFALDFLIDDLKQNVGDSGRPVVIMQHFRVVDENWWTYSAADRFHQVIQDYNVAAILVGHQGGGVNNLWRGYHWISSNGDLVVCRIKDNVFSAVTRFGPDWERPMQKKIFPSFAASGLPAVVNNGDWATDLTATSATLSGKIIYGAVSPTEVTLYWGTTDGGKNAEAWQHSKPLGVHEKGVTASTEITGLKPWTTYYYRAAASNRQGVVWADAPVTFHTSGILPKDWQTRFVGYSQRSGMGAHHDGGVFTLRGSGRDIGERSERIDNFQFAYQPLKGDGEIVARITGSEVTSREPKVGVMLRESPGDDARNVALLLTPKDGVRLSSRSETGGESRSSSSVIGGARWVKLARTGDTFAGYVSVDGEIWKAVGSPLTVEMGSDIYAGLAVTAGNRDGSKNHTASFDHVSVSTGDKPAPGQTSVLDHRKLLEAQDFWDNRDFAWFQANIPFLDTPDAGLNTTYYYRWELVTKHLTYGSPDTGYMLDRVHQPPVLVRCLRRDFLPIWPPVLRGTLAAQPALQPRLRALLVPHPERPTATLLRLDGRLRLGHSPGTS